MESIEYALSDNITFIVLLFLPISLAGFYYLRLSFELLKLAL